MTISEHPVKFQPACPACGIHGGHLPNCSNEIMRRDMIEEGNRVHAEALEQTVAGTHTIGIKGEDRPLSVGAVFEQEFGPVSSDADVARMAHTLLEEHCTGIVYTGLQEWAAIQRAMEAAVRFDPRDL